MAITFISNKRALGPTIQQASDLTGNYSRLRRFGILAALLQLTFQPPNYPRHNEQRAVEFSFSIPPAIWFSCLVLIDGIPAYI
eukprot:scaffold498984_cov18-Prasinocladus_malaysianus.AAC.1